MKDVQAYTRTLLRLTASTLVVVMVFIGCGAKEDPFAVGERVTPTPTGDGATAPTSEPDARTDTTQVAPGADDSEAERIIKIVEWEDNGIKLENMLVGYVIVHGYDYDVEFVEMEASGYKDALVKGEVDVVLEMSRTKSSEWYKQHTDSGAIVDAGSLFHADSDIRIGVHSGLKERAPEVVAFLEKLAPGEEQLADLASLITEDRFGIKPNVAALMFLKNNQDTWTQWVTPSVAENVKSALDGGKTTLRRERCVSSGRYYGSCEWR